MAHLWPDGLACPHCGRKRGLGVHRHHRAPVLGYQCPRCGAVFNTFSGTALAGSHRRRASRILILRGIAQGRRPPGWPARSPTKRMRAALDDDFRRQVLNLLR